jgi:uncharacterized protein (DUF362 family)
VTCEIGSSSFLLEMGMSKQAIETQEGLPSVTNRPAAGQSKARIYLDKLCSMMSPGGGWSFAADPLNGPRQQPAHPEPTCLALLALSLEADSYGEAIRSGWAFLDRCLTSDGAYKAPGGREEAFWPTALVLFTQAALGYGAPEVRLTTSRLLGLYSRIPRDPSKTGLTDINLTLPGWTWVENDYAWVEPTAWACLALRRAGQGAHPRVAQGQEFLLDRTLEEGGTNHAGRRLFGQPARPLAEPTALALLALQGRGQHLRVQAAGRFLMENSEACLDLRDLCWTKLALDSYRGQTGFDHVPEALDARIEMAYRARAAASWCLPSPACEALTALALSTEAKNLFRLVETEVSRDTLVEAAPPPRYRSWPGRVQSFLRGIGTEAAGFFRQTSQVSAVHISPVKEYGTNLAIYLDRQYENFCNQAPLTGRRVLLKINLVDFHPDRVIHTHPLVVAAAIELCRKWKAAEVVVAEGSGFLRNTEQLVALSGLGDVLSHFRVPFVDLNHDEPVKVSNKGRLSGMDHLYLARAVATADVLISIAKLKTHGILGATLSLPNLLGTLPGICYGWPNNELHGRGIENGIVDIALTRPPDLAIVDGIVAMDGDGPLNGVAKPLGALVFGSDPVAVDATCFRLMNLNPEMPNGYLTLAYGKSLGLLKENEIHQIGEPIAALANPFKSTL